MKPPLDEERLLSVPERVSTVRRVVVFDRTGSTNDDARRLAALGAPAWTVVVAGGQQAGRGRLGRVWFSSEGLGIYVSAVLRPRRTALEAARWTLAASVAAAGACAASGAGEITIKWPNDVLASGRKVAGILSELRTSPSGAHELIVGAGFNVYHEATDFPEHLRPLAASLRMAGARQDTTRESVVESWLERFADLSEELDAGAWSSVAERWGEWARGAEGTSVRVLSSEPGGEPWTGVTRGLDPYGALRVERAGGETVVVRAAESIVPLEG